MSCASYAYSRLSLSATGVFDLIADHCILLAMPNRLDRAFKRLHEDRPHSSVTIQLNPGYENKDDLVEKTSRADICHAIAAAFRRALDKEITRLLVLEDDFFLGNDSERSLAREASKDIAVFLKGRTFDTYNLGRVVFTGWPSGHGSWRAIAHGTAHGVVYSERFMRTYLAQHDADPWPIVRVGNDLWWNRMDMVHYVYERPLVFQLYPRTANRELWNDALKEFGISALNLDKTHEPGYAVLNGLSKASLPLAVILASMAALASVRLIQRKMTQKGQRNEAVEVGGDSARDNRRSGVPSPDAGAAVHDERHERGVERAMQPRERRRHQTVVVEQ